MNKSAISRDLSGLIRDFFCQRLMQQRNASRRTVAGYRDSLRLLLRFMERQLGKKAVEFRLEDLDASLMLAFLNFLEKERCNCIRTRNVRLAALRSFLGYAALQEPAALPQIQRVLSIPLKRFERPTICFLTREEIESVLTAPGLSTWSDCRDRTLFTVLYNTGARVSEIIDIKRSDVECERCCAVHLHGKGRKERVVPLWKRTTHLLRSWMMRIDSSPQQSLFPNRFGQPMTRSGVEKRLQKAVIVAGKQCQSINNKNISPHTIRHTTAIHLLQSGVDLTVIALWLGHESIETTHSYLQANLAMKEQALSHIKEPHVTSSRYKPSNDVLAFLNSL